MSVIDFWRGKQGNDYIGRNSLGTDTLNARCLMWQKILANCYPNHPKSILEVGCNVGRNLRALKRVAACDLIGVEPNAEARSKLQEQDFVCSDNVLDGTIQKLPVRDGGVDLAFTCGVLIHIHPKDLLDACREVVRVSNRWVVAIEYFSAKPEMVIYQGEQDKLWKRDFGQFYMENFKLRPVHVGFEWKPLTGLDNLTWWVFEK